MDAKRWHTMGALPVPEETSPTAHVLDYALGLRQVERNGETVDLLINLFYMAMHGRRSELAFPSSVSRSFVFPPLRYFGDDAASLQPSSRLASAPSDRS